MRDSVRDRADDLQVATLVMTYQNKVREGRHGPGRNFQQRTRAKILARDESTCVYCGGDATEVDHVIPSIRGGPSTSANGVASCRDCNAEKNDSIDGFWLGPGIAHLIKKGENLSWFGIGIPEPQPEITSCARPGCPNQFTPSHGRYGPKRFCSDKCKKLVYSDHYEQAKHRCPECGTLHTPSMRVNSTEAPASHQKELVYPGVRAQI